MDVSCFGPFPSTLLCKCDPAWRDRLCKCVPVWVSVSDQERSFPRDTGLGEEPAFVYFPRVLSGLRPDRNVTIKGPILLPLNSNRGRGGSSHGRGQGISRDYGRRLSAPAPRHALPKGRRPGRLPPPRAACVPSQEHTPTAAHRLDQPSRAEPNRAVPPLLAQPWGRRGAESRWPRAGARARGWPLAPTLPERPRTGRARLRFPARVRPCKKPLRVRGAGNRLRSAGGLPRTSWGRALAQPGALTRSAP